MNRDLVEAFGTNFVGLILFGGILSMITNPPLGMSSQQLMIVGLIFPLLAYVVTNKLYPDQFWKAFFGSVLFGVVLLMVGLWLLINMGI